MSPCLLGVDFSCAPSQRKPITAAWGQRQGTVVRLEALEALPTLEAFEALLSTGHPRSGTGWIGGFDFPFGLPRCFVDALAQTPPQGWPATDADAARSPAEHLITQLRQHCGDRQGFQALVDGWGRDWGQGSRPATLPHRRADTALPGISSTSPLQTRYVPVGKMYFEGLSRLVRADVVLPGLQPYVSVPDVPPRLALEAYPGLLAQEILGRGSYKSDDRAQQSHERLLQRLSLIDALEQGRTRLGLRLKLSPAQRDHLASDPQGDRLDAVLCLLQAGWAHLRWSEGDTRCGLPTDIDPVEGWILTT